MPCRCGGAGRSGYQLQNHFEEEAHEDELDMPSLLTHVGDGSRGISRTSDVTTLRVGVGFATLFLVAVALFQYAWRPATASAGGHSGEGSGAGLPATMPHGVQSPSDPSGLVVLESGRGQRAGPQQEAVPVWSGTIKSRYGICLDAGKRSQENGHKVLMRTCLLDTTSQQWVHDESTGLIKNAHGICLDSPDPDKIGGKVHMWQCYPKAIGQQWEYDQLTGRIKSRGGLCLDAPEPNKDGSVVHVWKCDGSLRAQQWNLEYNDMQRQGDGADHPVPVGEIKSRHGLCLVATDITRNGAAVRMDACNPEDENQKWAHDLDSGLIRVQRGICLDAPDPNKAGGTVHLWKCFPSLESQQWEVDEKTGLIKSRHGVCLDAPLFTDPGSKVRLWACDPSLKGQQWSQAMPLRSSVRGLHPTAALGFAFASTFMAGLAAIFRA